MTRLKDMPNPRDMDISELILWVVVLSEPIPNNPIFELIRNALQIFYDEHHSKE